MADARGNYDTPAEVGMPSKIGTPAKIGLVVGFGLILIGIGGRVIDDRQIARDQERSLETTRRRARIAARAYITKHGVR